MADDDPLHAFEADHVELNDDVIEVVVMVEAMARMPHDRGIGVRLADRLATLRDDLVMHFVREEEALFPGLSAELPSASDAIAELIALHDEICATVARMVHMAEVPDRSVGLIPVFNRFETAYIKHAQAERALFELAAARLTPVERSALATKLRGPSSG